MREMSAGYNASGSFALLSCWDVHLNAVAVILWFFFSPAMADTCGRFSTVSPAFLAQLCTSLVIGGMSHFLNLSRKGRDVHFLYSICLAKVEMHNYAIIIGCLLRKCAGGEIETNEMGRACGAYGGG